MPIGIDSSLSGSSNDDSTDQYGSGPIPNTNFKFAPIDASNGGASGAIPAETNASSSPTISGETLNAAFSDLKSKYNNIDSPYRSVDGTLPGRRLSNPLSAFASYTYQISLYMITPDAYNLFIQNGRKNLNAFNTGKTTSGPASGGGGQNNAPGVGGAFLIAQSGGINNTNEQRAAGFEYDYYIDNLVFKTNTTGNENGSATNITTISFNITEPYGFSFISNLRRASSAIQQYSSQLADVRLRNPSKQFFILGIRFYGYDQSGNIVTPNYTLDGSPLDPNSTTGALFEHYYEISMTKINFRIDGTRTIYSLEGAHFTQEAAFGVKSGLLKTSQTCTGSTVNEVLQSLVTALNEEQQNFLKNKTIGQAATYYIDYAPDDSPILIGDATIVTKADLNKARFPGSNAKNTQESTDASGITVQVNNGQRSVIFSNSLPVLQCIELTIMQSSYLEDALNVVYQSKLEADTNKDSFNQITNPDTRPISWFTVSAGVKNPRWDDIQQEWVFDITYTINKYVTPVVNSTYVTSTSKYYGPHKRYEYWYTGKNNEIIRYDQTLNNSYFAQQLAEGAVPSAYAPVTGAGSPSTTGLPTGAASSIPGPADGTGMLAAGPSTMNQFVTNLYDPGGWARATIEILGDPDYLIETSSSSLQQVYSKFYGTDGFTINPNGGQVFIEIDFKEGVDYVSGRDSSQSGSNAPGGTLDLNSSIVFWDYPQSVIIKGISYQVLNVTSTFRDGSFTQSLLLNINNFGDPTITPNANSQNMTNNVSTNTGPSKTGGPGTTQTTPPADKTAKPAGTATQSSLTGGAPPKQTPPVGNNET